jgi:lysophospholipase L1-like esterase
MKYKIKLDVFAICLLCFLTLNLNAQKIADSKDYLDDIKTELKKEWPKNRTINLVFHGHSVPAGFFKTPVVNTLESYPYLLLKELKTLYPYAVINIINTSIGGENSIRGEKRFELEVLNHKPDVLFIDYALNDIEKGLEKPHEAWNSMISKALKKNIKIILLTPSPDQRVDILEPDNKLEKHAEQIKQLSKTNGIGLVKSYEIFKNKLIQGDSISTYMSQVNHPNKKGHQLITDELIKFFK